VHNPGELVQLPPVPSAGSGVSVHNPGELVQLPPVPSASGPRRPREAPTSRSGMDAPMRHDADLRTLLREVAPRDFALRAAWRAVIQGLRERKRATGIAGGLGSRAAVERALASPLRPGASPDDLAELKALLRAIVREEGDPDTAERIDALVAGLLPRAVTGRVTVGVTGWPDDFGPELQARLLRRGGPPPLELDAEDAAALVREFDGDVLAGRTLRATARLADDEALPPVSRGLRSKPMRRGRQGPWLPHHDEVGKRSLTPRSLARRQAERLMAAPGFDGTAIDGFCGLGGNAIALAEAGAQVVAVELDRSRAELARRNAAALGVADRIDVRCGDVVALLPELSAGAALFLDPPWTSIDLAALPLPDDRLVVLKLPREFPTDRLPGDRWTVHYEFGDGADDAAIIRMLTALRPPA
jgi:hypothetical protein